MKGPVGILIAAFFGIAGMAFNWIYIGEKTKSADVVAFIGVKDGAGNSARRHDQTRGPCSGADTDCEC
jgi:hypothetical protein